MTVGGYDAARQKKDAVARALRDMALLIGEPTDEPIALETGGQIVPGLGFLEDAKALAVRATDLNRGLFKIIVLGEFKNGKSTLLNGMLGSKTLPAKAAPATAIITQLVYGESEDVTIYELDKPEPRIVRWEEFVQEFQLSRQDQETLQDHGTIDRFQNVEYAQVERRHPICANGVKLIDSPGLGEHISRTRVATNFLKQSQAVIFVLNATRILSQDEREFIETVLGQGRLNHVFFVVNRINQVDEKSADDIRHFVESGLAHHFLDDNGKLDQELYNRRVFFVDAKGALDARMTPPTDEQRLEATGVPALERELEVFLATDEKVVAALQSTTQFLLPVMSQARRRIDEEKAALDHPLEDLERRRAESEDRLRRLEDRKNEIERTIMLFAETVRQKVYGDLRTYIDEMEETWPEDSRQLIDLDGAISIKNLAVSYAQRVARERMAAAIAEQVQRYLRVKFGQWSDRIPALVRHDVETLVAEVEAQVDDFQLELDQIASLFAGTVSTPGSGARTAGGARLLDLALSLSDITGMTDSILETGDWAGAIARMAQQAVIVLIVGTLVTGGNFLIALLIVEAIHLGMHENEVRKRIRETLGERLHTGLQEQVTAKQAYIYDVVEKRFQQFAESMTGVIQKQVDEVRAEQERILRKKQDEHFSVDREKQRLDIVGEKLLELFGDLTEAAYGNPVDLAQVSTQST